MVLFYYMGFGVGEEFAFVANARKVDWRKLFRGDGGLRPAVPAEVPKGEACSRGVVTDQGLLQDYFQQFHRKTVYPISTDKFLDKSRNEYNPAWLSREIVQNFVDHNPKNPG